MTHQSSIHGNDREKRGPESLDRVDAESSKIASKSHAHELDEQGQHELVPKSDETLAVEEAGLLHKYHAVRICCVNGDVESDGRKHLLLERPGARVEGVADTPDGDAPVRQGEFKDFGTRI